MFICIFIIVLVAVWVYMAYEFKNAPLEKDVDDIDDPTTTCWHDN